MSFWETFWVAILWCLWATIFIAYLMALFSILTDIIRDRDQSGWAKAIWILFLIFVPFLTALVYLVTRGEGMSRRSAQAMRQKFLTLARPVLNGRADQLADAILSLERFDRVAKATQLGRQ